MENFEEEVTEEFIKLDKAISFIFEEETARTFVILSKGVMPLVDKITIDGEYIYYQMKDVNDEEFVIKEKIGKVERDFLELSEKVLFTDLENLNASLTFKDEIVALDVDAEEITNDYKFEYTFSNKDKLAFVIPEDKLKNIEQKIAVV